MSLFILTACLSLHIVDNFTYVINVLPIIYFLFHLPLLIPIFLATSLSYFMTFLMKNLERGILTLIEMILPSKLEALEKLFV